MELSDRSTNTFFDFKFSTIILVSLIGVLVILAKPVAGHSASNDSVRILALIDSARVHENDEKLALQELDSAYRLISQIRSKQLIVDVLIGRGDVYLKNNQLIKADSNLRRARKILDAYPKNEKYLAVIRKLIICNYFQGKYQDVLILSREGLQEAKAQNNSRFKGVFLNSSGVAYSSIGDQTSALEYYIKALNIFNQLKLPNDIAKVELNMGVVYDNQGNPDAAEAYYLKALNTGKSLKNKQNISTALNNLGNLYAGRKDFKKALNYFLQSLSLNREIDDLYGAALALNNVGDSYKNLNDTAKAYLYYDSARVLAKRIGDNNTYALSLTSLAEFYKQFQHNLSKAILLGQEALLVSKKRGDVQNLLASLNLLNKLYAQKSDYPKAYAFLNQYQNLHDSLYSKEKSLQLVKVEKRYEFREQDRKMELIKQKQKTAQAYFIVSILGLLVLLGIFIFSLRTRVLRARALKKQKQFVDNLLEESETHVSVMDSNANVTYLSPSYHRDFGYNVDDRVGRSPFDFVHPDDVPQLGNLLKLLTAGKVQKQTITFRLKNQAGEYRYVQGVVKNMLHNPELKGFILNFWDITDAKKTELALEESERKFRQIFNTISDIYFRIDLRGIIIEISPSVKKIAGYEPEEVIGKTADDFMEIEVGWDKARRVFSRWGHIDDFDIMIKATDGRLVYCSLNAHLIKDKNGDLVGYEGNLRDISAREKAKQELKRSEKELQKANDSKDKILSIIGHDLMGPIGTQKAILDMLSDEIDDFSKEEMVNLLKSMRPSMDATFTMIENLLSWARIMRKSIVPHLVENEVYPIAIKSFELLEQQARNKNVQLIYEGSKDIRAVFDKNLMEIVIRNLLSNAIKFSKPKDTVVVKVRKTVGSIEVSVSDQGMGMTDEDIRKVFSETEKMESKAGTNREKGTGLGLVIVKEFVQKNNGQLRIESKEGKGITFIFTLPKAG